MSTRGSKRRIEELRALFILGIIGTLLSVRDVLNADLGYGLTVSLTANFLILYWGAYVFLMAIGISDDWIYPPICNACKRAAQVAFYLGISVTGATALFIPLVLLLLLFIPQSASVVIAVAASSLFAYFVARQISRKLPKPLEVSAKEGGNGK